MGATYDSEERNPPPWCLPGTRKEELEKIDAWAKAGAEGRRVLWLRGPAGVRKSATAWTVSEICAGRNQLAASFFFARTATHRNDARFTFPTITVQIALSAPEKRQRLDRILSDDPFIAERVLGSVDLLASLLDDGSAPVPQASSPFLVTIDECQRNDDQCWILTQVSRMVHTYHLPLWFLIVSRSESHLREAFEERDLASVTKVLSLYGDHRASNNVFMYLREEFSRIYCAKRYREVMQSVPRP